MKKNYSDKPCTGPGMVLPTNFLMKKSLKISGGGKEHRNGRRGDDASFCGRSGFFGTQGFLEPENPDKEAKSSWSKGYSDQGSRRVLRTG